MSTIIGWAGREARIAGRLEQLWETPHTLLARIATVDHKALGLRYIITGFVFFFLGGVEAALLRAQLARPGAHLLSPEAYNQLFTMHGTTMMFLFIQPVFSEFSFYLTPLMIGSREVAFPRLNSFSYFVFLFAGIFLYASFLIGQAPDAGWFNYTPLPGPLYDSGLNIDFYNVGLVFLGISSTVGAINLIVTILKLRAPGMSIDKMPLFQWSSLTMSFAVLFGYPPLTAACTFLELFGGRRPAEPARSPRGLDHERAIVQAGLEDADASPIRRQGAACSRGLRLQPAMTATPTCSGPSALAV